MVLYCVVSWYILPKAADNNYNDAQAVEKSDSITEVDSAESNKQHL